MRLLKKLVLLVFSSQNSHPSYHFAKLVVGKTGILLGLRQNYETLCFLLSYRPYRDYTEVCKASEVFLRKVKFVYDK